ncbi:ABC transporter substrate-binding protein [Phycicoccus duodecadis]|uniref:Peptide/nickel transport system substrate-binding protein n=1 Tax=Phycicoccus duodecadis TaxID=173053 RepID=A0A2N3YM22_9MICO|nr:ABC transporter substrate-binding protein [Phycicoccus duodecadis]PKW27859.1 peptide/nickel transport system substrate-binding protein [Phycicoccus duodecadis]
MRSPRLVGGVVAALAALAMTACAPSAPQQGSAASGSAGGGDTLRIATTTDVVNLNPMLGNSRTDSWVTDLMYPRLMTIAADGSKKPYLAKSWGYSDDGKTGWYEIRDDFTWSDGTKLTAKDVAYTINTIKTKNPKGGVVNGFMGSVDSAKAVSDTRVEIALTRPDSIVVPEVGFWMTVVPEHVFSTHENIDDFANDSNWVSAGPYKLSKVAKGQSYTLERVAGYPVAPDGKPTLAAVEFKVYPDVNTEILALKKGDVDVIANALPPAQVDSLRSTDGIAVEEVPGLGFTHMTYNMKRKPLDDPRVRQALAHAVDYDSIRKVAVQGQAVTANSSPITDSLKQYANPDLKEYSYDPEMSKKLLAEAGVSNPTFTMIYSLQDPVVSAWTSIVKEGAAKAGITIELKGMDRNTYLAKTSEGDYDIYAGSFAIMDEPVSNMALQYLPDGAINYSQVDDPKLTSLIQQAQGTVDPEQQMALVRQAAAYVHDEMIDNIMYVQNLYVAHRADWTGFVTKPSELLSIIDPESLAQVTRSK